MLWGIFSKGQILQFSDYLIAALPFMGLLLAFFMVSKMEFAHFPVAVNYFRTRVVPVKIAYLAILILLAMTMREMIMMFLPLPFFLYGPINYLSIVIKGVRRG
jgi:hypothetical protein